MCIDLEVNAYISIKGLAIRGAAHADIYMMRR